MSEWWARNHPDYEVVVGEGGSPWRKAEAVDRGIAKASGEIIIVADADVVCGGIAKAVAALEAGAPWVIPHGLVHRLSPTATALAVLADQGPAKGAEHDAATNYRNTERPYTGWAGGGLVVIWRSAWDIAPIDPRFVGWGQEDAAWALCLDVLIGRHVRLNADLYHLWHPPQPRRDRRVGNSANETLWTRYKRCLGRPDRMAALVAEGRKEVR